MVSFSRRIVYPLVVCCNLVTHRTTGQKKNEFIPEWFQFLSVVCDAIVGVEFIFALWKHCATSGFLYTDLSRCKQCSCENCVSLICNVFVYDVVSCCTLVIGFVSEPEQFAEID